MSTAQELLDADQVIRSSMAALGEAIGAVSTQTPPAFARAVQARHNLMLQIEAEYGLLTSTQTGQRMGSRSKTPRNLAAATRLAGRLLAVTRGNAAYYPGFQFDSDGQPLLAIAQLCKLAAQSHWSEHGVIEWLMAPTTYLGGERPVDLLVDDPGSVLDAARAAWNVSW